MKTKKTWYNIDRRRENFFKMIIYGGTAMEKSENKTLKILLKVLIIVGIVAAAATVAKILYDKYKERLSLLYDDDADCDFECLENDELDCDCDSCQYNRSINGDAEKACEIDMANCNVETAETAEAYAD